MHSAPYIIGSHKMGHFIKKPLHYGQVYHSISIYVNKDHLFYPYTRVYVKSQKFLSKLSKPVSSKVPILCQQKFSKRQQ